MASVSGHENFDRDFNKAVEAELRHRFSDISELKPVQEESLLQFIKRRDVFSVLPTGYGKSLIFELVPGVCSFLHNNGYDYPKEAILVVICPLDALIEAHIEELVKRGIKACCLSDPTVKEAELSRGEFSFIFTSPELLVKNEKWRTMLKSPVYQKNLFGVVTDEAHVVPKWGKAKSNQPRGRKAAFRECFFKIGEVRSILPQGTPVMALTATATMEIKQETMKGLAMKKDTFHVCVSPDRRNIYLDKCKVSKNIEDTFKWLIDDLKMNSIETPRTIIYCKSQKECGRLFRHFRYELGSSAYYPGDSLHVASNMLIGMYHANTLVKHKLRVKDSLFDEDGVCRVVFASTALGMGINFRDIRRVVHYGPPREMEDFVQEIGRGGRDGCQAQAVLLFTGGHLRKCEDAIKDYAKSTETCLRQIMLEKFGEKAKVMEEGHKCCVICHKNCKCSGSSCSEEIKNFITTSKKSDHTTSRTVLPYQKEELKELLDDYQSTLISKCPAYLLSPESTTGFSNGTIQSILKTCKYLFTVDDVMQFNPIFNKQYAFDILYMIRDVFEDFELDKYKHNQEEDLEVTYDMEYGGIYRDSDSSDGSIALSDGSDISGITEL